jgi:hypothetical protein
MAYNIENQEIEETSHKKEHATRGTKRKGVKSLNKRAKDPMVWVMAKMVDDVISTNYVTSKAIQGDFMKKDIHEMMKCWSVFTSSVSISSNLRIHNLYNFILDWRITGSTTF